MAAGYCNMTVTQQLPIPTVNPQNRKNLANRVTAAAEAALAAQHYVSSLDILMGIGWLDANSAKRWRQGQVDYLERVVQANLSRISEAMHLFRSWAVAHDLKPRPIMSRGPPGGGHCASARAAH
jgi:hypothetical protein